MEDAIITKGQMNVLNKIIAERGVRIARSTFQRDIERAVVWQRSQTNVPTNTCRVDAIVHFGDEWEQYVEGTFEAKIEYYGGGLTGQMVKSVSMKLVLTPDGEEHAEFDGMLYDVYFTDENINYYEGDDMTIWAGDGMVIYLDKNPSQNV